jgi:O-antigen/teichoic acid export membrane protein
VTAAHVDALANVTRHRVHLTERYGSHRLGGGNPVPCAHGGQGLRGARQSAFFFREPPGREENFRRRDLSMTENGPSRQPLTRRPSVAGNALANFAGQLATMIVGFALTPFMLGRLGATDYGMWVLASTFVLYGSLLDLGVGVAVTKYVSEYSGRRDLGRASALIATALRMYTALAVVALVIGGSIAVALPEWLTDNPADQSKFRDVFLMAVVGVAVQLPASCSHATLRGLQRYDLINALTIAAALTFATVTVIVLLAGGGVVALVFAMIPLTVLWQVPAIWLIRRSAPTLRYGWKGADRTLARPIFSFSGWLVLAQASSMIKTKTDELLIAGAFPIGRVASYAVARRLSEIPGLVTYQYTRLLLPMASEVQGQGDDDRLRRLLLESSRVSLALCVPLTLLIVGFGDRLLAAWVGAEFAGAASVASILVVAVLIQYITSPAATILMAVGHHRRVAIVSAMSAGLNITASIALLRWIGFEGVAWGTLVAAVVEFTLLAPFVIAQTGVRALQTVTVVLVPNAIATVPAVAVLFMAEAIFRPTTLLHLGVLATAVVAVYGSTILALPGSGRERRALGALLGRRSG